MLSSMLKPILLGMLVSLVTLNVAEGAFTVTAQADNAGTFSVSKTAKTVKTQSYPGSTMPANNVFHTEILNPNGNVNVAICSNQDMSTAQSKRFMDDLLGSTKGSTFFKGLMYNHSKPSCNSKSCTLTNHWIVGNYGNSDVRYAAAWATDHIPGCGA
jgi:hypothetical protein